MPQTRRSWLQAVAGSALGLAPGLTALAAAGRQPLAALPVASADGSGVTRLDAIDGQHRFGEGVRAATRGFGQPYLGPVLRLRRGATGRVEVRNRLDEPLTVHWHGLHVPGDVDGGPHQSIAPGDRWTVSLDIDQPATTAWYHSHVHGRTGPHVNSGLAGLVIIDDPTAVAGVLPARLGVDDLPLVLQDRAFTADGQLRYTASGPARMMGFRGDRVVVNGQLQAVQRVPPGVVRLRLLNACSARTLALRFEDGRPMHQIGSDGGLFARPVAQRSITLATGERAEVLVDFSSGGAARLLSAPDQNSPMGMMGGGMGGGMGRGMGRGMGGGMMGLANPPALNPQGEFEVLAFEVAAEPPAGGALVTALPGLVPGAAPVPTLGEPVRQRTFVLDTHGMMGGGGMGMMGNFTINGRAFDMRRIDEQLRRGMVERWVVRAGDMAHPFHVHGTSFQVLSRNGRAVDFATTGWKDTVLVDGEAELLMRFDHRAGEHTPYMFHCHILEHEDAGMMGQFVVQ